MLIALLALMQQQPAQAPAGLPASPVAKLEIAPGPNVTVTAGDTLRLRARALDANGQPVANAAYTFAQGGGYFEGRVTQDGLVTAGSTGTIPVSVVARVPGTRPFVQQIEVKMVPGPAAAITVTPAARRLAIGQRMRYVAEVRSAAGDVRPGDVVKWSSSNSAVLAVRADGMATAQAAGRADLVATSGAATTRIPVEVVATAIARVEVMPGTVDAKTGDVVRFRAVARDAAGREIAGLTPTWSFAPGDGQLGSDGAFVGYVAGSYTVTASFGTRSGEAAITLAPRDVRRPATVVGRLPRTLFNTEEVWLHPTEEVAYLGTGGGGDRMYAIDISDKTKPVVTDSIVTNTRRVNDLMTTPDGKTLVFTREGASDRKNGIVIASLEDPRHPKVIAEFTQGVEGGVHSAFVYRQEPYGTHVFLTNDGTGAIHVVNIDDPAKPREVAQWRTDRPEEGRTLHDVDVQDGLAYLSYWNDGLVILDVGNGVKGGSPSNPQLVAQVKYDLNAMYREVEATAGPGFIRGTHTAWRHKDYVFIADEVFPAAPVKGAKDAAAGRAYGRLQVVDVSDLAAPKIVAHYEPEYGGVHNIWVAGDTLYMGAYNGGFRAFDVSGELRGDLRAQGREMVHVHTGDMDGKVANSPMTWGVVVRNGLAYVNDMHNGLWIVRMEPKRRELVP
ncbi:MAG TPA: Ig-like domain-containing protein [Gemmatimonadales bacterium]|nr:Ig-like domain-containing protein [Gemmatimonadales bacterium]